MIFTVAFCLMISPGKQQWCYIPNCAPYFQSAEACKNFIATSGYKKTSRMEAFCVSNRRGGGFNKPVLSH